MKNDKFIGASIWLRELDSLEKIVKTGLSQGWAAANNEKALVFD
jgi:hypothetical protein